MDIAALTFSEISEYIDFLENEVKGLRRKTDNRKKLTKGEVVLMRKLWKEGRSQAELSEIFDVNSGTVSRTVRRIYHR